MVVSARQHQQEFYLYKSEEYLLCFVYMQPTEPDQQKHLLSLSNLLAVAVGGQGGVTNNETGAWTPHNSALLLDAEL